MTPRQKRKRIEALVAAWQKPLGLEGWTLGVAYNHLSPEQASCVADPEYRQAKLTFNLRRLSAHEVDETVAHEMCHCHGWALAALALKWAGADKERREVVRQAEELLVTGVSRTFLPLLPKVVSV